MGKTKEYSIANNGFAEEEELRLESELLRQKEEEIYYTEFKKKHYETQTF